MIAAGFGAHPGSQMSTGSKSSAPCPQAYPPAAIPPETAQVPAAMTHFGSGIASYVRSTTSLIAAVIGPVISNTSAARGDGVKNIPN